MGEGAKAPLPAGMRGLWAEFDDLTNRQLHDLLRLRQDVFIVEQRCLFPDIDGKDPDAQHFLLLSDDGGLAAAIRVFLADGRRRKTLIGRVVVGRNWRGRQLGHHLMREAVKRVEEGAPGEAVYLSAQAHLQAFYAGYGFRPCSDLYLEDGIEHVDMVRNA